MKIRIKLDEAGNVVVDENGLPIFIFEETGKEAVEKAVDVASLFTKIKDLNGESKEHRLARNEAVEKLKPLMESGIEDISLFLDEALKNKETVANFEEKDYKSADDVNKIKAGVSESYEEKIKGLDKIIQDMKSSGEQAIASKDVSIRKLMIRGAFESSNFVRDNTVLTPELAFNTFGTSFDIDEDGDNNLSVFAKNRTGDRIFSLANPGAYADPEEAIELIIKEHPDSNSILKTSTGGGDQSTGPSSKEAITNAELLKLSPTERLKKLHRSNKTGR